MKRYTEVERLAACAWADFLIVSTLAPSLSSAERMLFGGSRFRTSANGNSVRPGILRRWLAGVVPNNTMLERMDRRVPGSHQLYCHPLWSILQCRGNPPDEMLYLLAPRIGELVHSRDCTGPIQRPTLNSLDSQLFEDIETLPTLDSLAALLFCVKRLTYETNFSLAIVAMKSFYRVALTLGAFRPLACVMPRLIAHVCQGFPLDNVSARWLPEPEIEHMASQACQLLASELLEEMATLPGSQRQLRWVQVVKILTTLFEPRVDSLAHHAYSLSFFLADGEYDYAALSAWGSRILAWMWVEELAPPIVWTTPPFDKRSPKEVDFSGILFNSWLEVESHTVRL